MTAPARIPEKAPASLYACKIHRAASALRGVYAGLGCPELYDECDENGGPDHLGLQDAVVVIAEYLEDLADAMSWESTKEEAARAERRATR
ncbi:hypothetical protein KGQ90_16385 [Modicisalibacter tunisiensis]|uniref:hypothetical protein n=1 Tax=Modicisalibacter tunisiensis TaxID=390637 RepID=UPI001CC98140|nr:hypothetical protein [Modicisalibacter tunisiensis]MBZ9540498.1 hypothetical protein [Modicisalibacter tunisiensis]